MKINVCLNFGRDCDEHILTKDSPPKLISHAKSWQYGKRGLMGVELPACHLNKGLLEMYCLPGKGIILHEV